MGFMDSLKKATGVGLNASEHYDRAYEKGVLLGPEKFADAVALFETAARKAAESGDSQTQTRALQVVTIPLRLHGDRGTSPPPGQPGARR